VKPSARSLAVLARWADVFDAPSLGVSPRLRLDALSDHSARPAAAHRPDGDREAFEQRSVSGEALGTWRADAAWVQNVRAAGEGTLARGRSAERVALTELPVAEREPILRAFFRQVPGGVRFFASADPETVVAGADRLPGVPHHLALTRRRSPRFNARAGQGTTGPERIAASRRGLARTSGPGAARTILPSCGARRRHLALQAEFLRRAGVGVE
jgi:hypothetical protein